MPQERDYLVKAREACQQALALYERAVGFADVPRNLSRAKRELEQIEQRLAELSPTSRLDVPSETAPWA